MENFDVIIIGAGPGGYVAAIRAAQKGLRAALIERGHIGGTCLNRGCIPTKALLHSAHVYRQAKESEIFGVKAGDVSFDIAKIYARKNAVVEQLRGGTELLLKSNGVTVIKGTAFVKNAATVTVNGDELRTKNIIIATGSRPNRLPEPMRNLPGVFTSDEALTSNMELPKRVLILGGGVIGVEFAGYYNGLGCEVTVVDAMGLILSRMDAEISKSLAKILAKRGIKIITSAELKDIRKSGTGLVCSVLCKNETKDIEADGVLVSIGRAPVTDCLPPEAGVALDARGFILTDGNMRTNVPGIYAIGDCVAGSAQLAHAASAQGLNTVGAILGEAPGVNMEAVPSCVYSSPEIAAVGITEAEALAKGVSVKVGKYLTTGNGKSIITHEERGFIKLVFEAETDALAGAQLMCARATDIIGELTAAVVHRSTASELAHIIRPHPTYAEAVTEAAESVYGLSVHTVKR